MSYNIGMLFSELSAYFGRIEKTNLRNEKTVILAELFAKLDASEVGQVAYLVLGRVAPLYDPTEIGMAGKQIGKAVAWSVSKTVNEIDERYKNKGDLGEVVEELKRETRILKLESSVNEVFAELLKIAKDSGKGSQERKTERLGNLLKNLGGMSAKYIVRLIIGKLRLGFSDLTMIDALSWAKRGDKGDRAAIEAAYSVWSDLGAVAAIYSEHGVEGLSHLGVMPGRPVKPMRAERLGTIPEIVEKLKEFAVEPKLDGMRVQIHAWDSNNLQAKESKQQGVVAQESMFGEGVIDPIQVKVFSRGLEDITHQFPEIVEEARKLQGKIGDFVIDGEAIGVDPSTGQFLPFQETITRKRKHDVEANAKLVPIRVYVFDVLYGVGGSTTSKSYRERRGILEARLQTSEANIFVLTQSHIVSTEPEAKQFFQQYVREKLEGMLCKKLDSQYKAGARDFNWVKYKKAHESDLADTLDCVVMGYYKGKGKRQKFGVGAFLVGVLGEEQKILTVAKIGTGLTDEQFNQLFAKLKNLESSTQNPVYVVAKSLEPDVWVEPEVIVEVEADEITQSPIHSSGYALRFPRLLRFRNDKKLGDITTVAEVAKI